jgi:hypothetical protein
VSVLSLADAKTHINVTGTAQDTEISAFIARAERAIAERVGPLEPEARTVRVTPTNSTLLVPSPAVSITSVTDSEGVALTVADLHLERAGLITYDDGRTFSSRWYDVVYLHGRSSCPADLVLAVAEMVRHLWDTQRGRSTPGGPRASEMTSNTIPGAAYLLPFRVAELIAPHRVQLVG